MLDNKMFKNMQWRYLGLSKCGRRQNYFSEKLLRKGMLNIFLVVMLLVASTTLHAILPNECGLLENAYGPFDYTNPQHFKNKLGIVEKGHFPAYVENLERGKAGALVSDLDYVLRAFPNHHRALYSIVRYSFRINVKKTKKPMYCYFARAMEFKPEDGMVRMIYGIYYYKQGKWEEALGRFKEAAQLAPDHSETQYNLGLTYLKLKNYDKALEAAKKAHQLGYPMLGLRESLKKLGKWVD